MVTPGNRSCRARKVKIRVARPSTYSPEFSSDAVALWRAAAGRRTFESVADDHNINHETLCTWVREAEGTPPSGGGPHGGGAEDERPRGRPASGGPTAPGSLLRT
ncbi:transposase [Kitasatospora sp. NPDC008050]|uniref:transposase n=1 Tax=Kitasatospora sp. NPDC008050 TaxID=3364021 RepID=UPI0036E5563B